MDTEKTKESLGELGLPEEPRWLKIGAIILGEVIAIMIMAGPALILGL